MALSRRRDSNLIWPGFVDAVTTLLMVLMFVLTIFTVMQSVLRDTITTQGNELSTLTDQVAALSQALGLQQKRADGLQAEIGQLQASLSAALADGVEQKGIIAGLRTDLAARTASVNELEAARLADAATLDALRKRLVGADTELAAMTLSLEAERKRAEETLTLLAAARTKAAQDAATVSTKDAALATAKITLLAEQEKVLKAARETELLNQQIAALRGQLGSLQQVLDASAAKDAAAQVQLETLGRQLNAALAQVASEQKARADLEAAERTRLEAEKADLERFRSEFFGQLSTLLHGRKGVRVVGDRFVFSSEVLFQPGAADLAPEGRAQIADVVKILNEVRTQIPPGIDWIIRVDGHTDDVPLISTAAFADNWELSQARALSVVRYMQNDLGFPPDRLAATGFGQYRPVAIGDSEAARAQNRRIELKLTER